MFLWSNSCECWYILQSYEPLASYLHYQSCTTKFPCVSISQNGKKPKSSTVHVPAGGSQQGTAELIIVARKRGQVVKWFWYCFMLASLHKKTLSRKWLFLFCVTFAIQRFQHYCTSHDVHFDVCRKIMCTITCTTVLSNQIENGKSASEVHTCTIDWCLY